MTMHRTADRAVSEQQEAFEGAIRSVFSDLHAGDEETLQRLNGKPVYLSEDIVDVLGLRDESQVRTLHNLGKLKALKFDEQSNRYLYSEESIAEAVQQKEDGTLFSAYNPFDEEREAREAEMDGEVADISFAEVAEVLEIKQHQVKDVYRINNMHILGHDAERRMDFATKGQLDQMLQLKNNNKLFSSTGTTGTQPVEEGGAD